MTVSSNYVPTAEGTNAWTSPTNARTHNATFATAAPAKNSTVAGIWKTFGITGLSGTITKVEVGLDWFVSTTASVATQSVEASYNAGTNWTAAVTMDTATTESHIADGQTEHWLDVTAGRSWTWAELNDTNFQVRWNAIRGNSTTAVTFSADVLYVCVTYTAPTEAYASEAILSYVAPCESYAAEIILAYVAPVEAYAGEVILDYTPSTVPCEVYATEAILNYLFPPCEVYAAEAVLAYIAPAEVYASEGILSYEPPSCEVYAVETVLAYMARAEVYAAEAILNYEFPPSEVYATEAILDYTIYQNTPCEAYAGEVIVNYNPAEPCEIYAVETILSYDPPPPDPCEVYATEIVLDYALPADGWEGWWQYWFVSRFARRYRNLVLHARKKNALGDITDARLDE